MACCDKGLQSPFDKMPDTMSPQIVIALALSAALTQLDLDCAKPERSRALIDYAELSEIEQVEDSCRLTVTHDQLREGANDELFGGWPMILSGLKTLLETGEKLTTPGSLRYSEAMPAA